MPKFKIKLKATLKQLALELEIMLHCILQTQDRLNRLNMPNASSPLCVQCTAGELDDIEHALLRCNKIKPGADFLLKTSKSEIPDLTLDHIKYLDFRSEDLLLPTYVTAATLSQLWTSRFSTRNFSFAPFLPNLAPFSCDFFCSILGP